jgi:hypothetical protein
MSLPRQAWPAWLLSALFLFLAALPYPSFAAEQSDITNWRTQQLRWHDNGGLPVDSEFGSPLVAQYNYAYGATVLGITAHRTGGEDYYAVIAVYDGTALTAMDVLGPLTAPPQFSIGRYHLAVAQPDGRVFIWLTAPGAEPKRLHLTDDAVPDAPLSCLALPPDPPSAKWEDWRIFLGYCMDTNPPYLELVYYRDAAEQTQTIFGLSLPSVLDAISLVGSDFGSPHVLFSVVDTAATNRSNAQVGVYLSSPGSSGWYTQRIAGAGNLGAVLHPGVTGDWETAIVLEDTSSAGFWFQQIKFATLATGMQAAMGGAEYFSTPFEERCISLFESKRSELPMLAYGDDADVSLVWREAQPGRAGSSLGISSLLLHQGETDTQGSSVYPIQAVAGTAHWSTGNPEIYWVQQGSIDNDTGQLFRIAFMPSAK